jgi:hypothetical protein
MKYRLEVYNQTCDRISTGVKVKDLFFEGVRCSEKKGFESFAICEDETGDQIFELINFTNKINCEEI